MQKVRLLLCFLLFILLRNGLQAQHFELARAYGGPAGENGLDIDLDGQGNVFNLGQFSGSITFGSQTLTNASWSEHGYVTKFDPSGIVLWSQKTTNTVRQAVYGVDLAVSSPGNAYVASTDAQNFSSLSFSRSFTLSSYSSSGQPGWSKTGNEPTSSSYSVSQDVAVDQTGNVYLLGAYLNRTIFGTDTLPGSGYFLTKYSAAGTLLWSRSIVVSGMDDLMDHRWLDEGQLALSPTGEPVISGLYLGAAAFGGSTSLSTSTTGMIGTFLAGYNSSGTVQWATNLNQTPNYPYLKGLKVDQSNNIYATGYFSGTLVIGSQTLAPPPGRAGKCFWPNSTLREVLSGPEMMVAGGSKFRWA